MLAITGESVYSLVEEASGFGSSGILVCLLAALFVKRGGVYAAWGSLIAGLASWILFAYIYEIPTPTSSPSPRRWPATSVAPSSTRGRSGPNAVKIARPSLHDQDGGR